MGWLLSHVKSTTPVLLKVVAKIFARRKWSILRGRGCMQWRWVHSACQMRACWGAPGLGMAEKGKESQWTLNFGQISKYTSTQWTLCTPFQFKVSLRNSRGWKTNSSLHSAHLVVIMAWFFQHSSDFQRPPSTAKKMLQKSFKNSPMS